MTKPIPHRITVARNNDFVHDSDIHKEWAMNLILGALVDPSFLDSTGDKPRLTNDDIATLVADRVADATIVRIVEEYEGEYEVSSQDLLDLRKSGVSDKIVEAMQLKEPNETSSQPGGIRIPLCCELIDYL